MNKTLLTTLCLLLLAGGVCHAAPTKAPKDKKDKTALKADKKAAKADKKDKAKDKKDKKGKKGKTNGEIKTTEELDAVLSAAALELAPTVELKLGGDLKGREIGELVQATQAGHALAGYSFSENRSTGKVTLSPQYHDATKMAAVLRDDSLRSQLTPDEAKAFDSLKARLDSIITPDMSDFDKLVAVHDNIINNARYLINDKTEKGSIAVLLNDKIALCTGYTRLAKVMLDYVGVPTLIVVGESKGPHTWNLVNVDGAWRHVDVTWDDPVDTQGGTDKLIYDYLGLSDADLSRDHTWDKTGLPEVTTDTPLYLTRKGMYCRNFDEFWANAEKAAEGGATKYEGYITDLGQPGDLKKSADAYMQKGGKLRIQRFAAPQGESRGTVILHFAPLN